MMGASRHANGWQYSWSFRIKTAEARGIRSRILSG
jgi:hypothetical protein